MHHVPEPPSTLHGVREHVGEEEARELLLRLRGPDAERGDLDPLDICVFSERPIDKSEIILTARVIGGFPMLDGGEADDKILAVLEGDYLWGEVRDVADLPPVLVERLRHDFLTYKLVPGETSKVEIAEAYGAERAREVVRAAMADYDEHFPR
jgi:inorganic pyrophosphatase